MTLFGNDLPAMYSALLEAHDSEMMGGDYDAWAARVENRRAGQSGRHLSEALQRPSVRLAFVEVVDARVPCVDGWFSKKNSFLE